MSIIDSLKKVVQEGRRKNGNRSREFSGLPILFLKSERKYIGRFFPDSQGSLIFSDFAHIFTFPDGEKVRLRCLGRGRCPICEVVSDRDSLWRLRANRLNKIIFQIKETDDPSASPGTYIVLQSGKRFYNAFVEFSEILLNLPESDVEQLLSPLSPSKYGVLLKKGNREFSIQIVPGKTIPVVSEDERKRIENTTLARVYVNFQEEEPNIEEYERVVKKIKEVYLKEEETSKDAEDTGDDENFSLPENPFEEVLPERDNIKRRPVILKGGQYIYEDTGQVMTEIRPECFRNVYIGENTPCSACVFFTECIAATYEGNE